MIADQTEQLHALELFRRGYDAQMRGALDEAQALYRASIEAFPTAEAHTFLGWAYGGAGRFEEAIDECKRAIAIDPDFGNPYNDAGAYLIELGRLDEAIPFLESATRARRYGSRAFPHFNLGRIFIKKGQFVRARRHFADALQAHPDYAPAAQAVAALDSHLQ